MHTEPPVLHTFAIGIEFNGAAYRGWQRQQKGVSSVQEALERALSKVANHPVEVVAAGRTDAGVHASNMIAHFQTHAHRRPFNWMRGVNTLLPADVAINWVQPTSNDFHARFKALNRRYVYVVKPNAQRPALLNKQVTHTHLNPDPKLMHAAAQHLVGAHDFTSFRAAGCQAKHARRNVHHAQIKRAGELIVLDIQADGFLHHMVRNIMGSLLEVGSEKQPTEWIKQLLEAKDRNLAAATAPPDGLYFANAQYPDQFELPALSHIGPCWLNTTEL